MSDWDQMRRSGDITAQDMTKWQLEGAANPREFARLHSRTGARLAVGHTGTRYPLRAQLRFWADHATAKDAVESELPRAFAEELGMREFQTRCADREQYLLRPDLGRQFCPQTLRGIQLLNPRRADVCIYLADGLSALAIQSNGMDTLLTARAALESKGLSFATPFVVRYGRVATMDHISQAIGSAATCVLIGERPGLGVADSMSAYCAYGATVGMMESRRTVISNIHAKGTPAVEAGAWLADLLIDMLRYRLSGIELRDAQNKSPQP